MKRQQTESVMCEHTSRNVSSDDINAAWQPVCEGTSSLQYAEAGTPARAQPPADRPVTVNPSLSTSWNNHLKWTESQITQLTGA